MWRLDWVVGWLEALCPSGAQSGSRRRNLRTGGGGRRFISQHLETLESRQMLSGVSAEVQLLDEAVVMPPFTIGHMTSFFKPDERPVPPIKTYVDLETNRLKLDEAYTAVRDLGGNLLVWGLWSAEDRPDQSWSDFIEFLDRLQVDLPDMRVLATLASPGYSTGTHFCWEIVADGDECSEYGDNADYVRWVTELANLSLVYPNLDGVLLDDLSHYMQQQPDHIAGVLWTQEYVASLRETAHGINPDFRFDGVFYRNWTTPYGIRQVDQYLDGVHYTYQNFDGDRNDDHPERLAQEIELFNRVISPGHPSEAVSLFHLRNHSLPPGESASVQATLDLTEISQDVLVNIIDNKAKQPEWVGYLEKRLYFDGELIYQADISEDDNKIVEVVIPWEDVARLRNAGRQTAVLQLEVVALRNIGNWQFGVAAFVRQPETLPVRWSGVEVRGFRIVGSSEAKEGLDRILLLYGGSPRSGIVTHEYTESIVSQAVDAMRHRRIDGLNVWEVMMQEQDSAIFKSYQHLFDAVRLQQDYGFQTTGHFHENWGGLQEKWLQDRAGKWYFLTPDGALFHWDGSGTASGTEIAKLGSAYHADPSLLYLANPVASLSESLSQIRSPEEIDRLAAELDETLRFLPVRNPHFNAWQLEEKRLQDSRGRNYIVTPDGLLSRWKATGLRPLAQLDSRYYEHPELLTEAAVWRLDAHFGFQSNGQLSFNWGGRQEKWIRDRVGRWYFIVPDGSIYRWDGSGSAQGTVVAALDDSYYRNPQRLYDAEARAVDVQLGLFVDGGLHQNWGGLSEKWLRGRDRQWYFLTPQGVLYRWDQSSSATGTLIARLGSAYYNAPARLYDQHARGWQERLRLRAGSNLHENWGGLNEKWIVDRRGRWYYITPDGSLYRWRYGTSADGIWITRLDLPYYHDPLRLNFDTVGP